MSALEWKPGKKRPHYLGATLGKFILLVVPNMAGSPPDKAWRWSWHHPYCRSPYSEGFAPDCETAKARVETAVREFSATFAKKYLTLPEEV